MTRNVFCGTLATMIFLALTAGCGPKSNSGTISGKVSFQDELIPRGTIAFIGQNGKVVSGNIAEGAYAVEGVEVGPNAKVTIMSDPPSLMMQPPTGQVDGVPTYPQGQFVRIPNRYSDEKQSGLTCEIVDGIQTHDFVLQP